MDVSIVIVNFNSGGRLSRLLDMLGGTVEQIVVVDNASEDGSAAGANRPGVSLIRNETNEGFARAANRAAAEARATWILFLNPDVHPAAEDLAALLDEPPSGAAVLAPLQTDAFGRPRPESGGYKPSVARFLAWALVPGGVRGRLGPWLAPPYPRGDRRTAWVSGAMMAVRRDTFEAVGGFDERFFLYQEDVDLCRRVRRAGGVVVCRGAIRVFHEVANGDPRRRAKGIPLFVRSLGMQFAGPRRRMLGAVLWLGFTVRTLAGDRAAAAGLRPALALLLPQHGATRG